MINKILTLTGFQITWFACVFGEYFNLPLLGLIIGILYLFVFFYFISNKFLAFQICLIFSIIGYCFDSLLSINYFYKINSELTFGYLPIWFLVLWPSFITLFVDVLKFLKYRPILAFFMGFILVPPTYFLGFMLDLAETNNLYLTMTIMAIFWGLFSYFYSIYMRKYS